MNPTAPTPEQQPAGQVPEVPQAPEVSTPVSSGAPAAPVPAVPQLPVDLQPPVAQPQAGVPAAPAGDANPVIADDVDVIEKEWVDKAQAVVDKTEGDPYAEEEAVEDLQVDYLKKRYDHQVDKPTD